MANPTHYELLGVSPDATADEIKAAFWQTARDLHPDANPDDPSAVERFKTVAAAYETLSDPQRRERYDMQLDSATSIPGEEVEDEPPGTDGWGEASPTTGQPGSTSFASTGQPPPSQGQGAYPHWFQYFLGEIAVTPAEVVTPLWTRPLSGTVWQVQENLWETKETPNWAVPLGIFLLWFCFLGVLLLLIKERKVSGWMQIRVDGPGGFWYTTSIPVQSAGQAALIRQQVDYVRWVSGTSQ